MKENRSSKTNPVYAGNALLKNADKEVSCEYVQIDGDGWYKISGYDRMPPFFMSIVSDSDHWMFIWTNGALTAGRKNPDHALFPYYTDDKLRQSAEFTGSKTILLVRKENGNCLWEPFSEKYRGVYDIHRNLYKNIYGNKVRFEEINQDLNLTYSYTWMNSERFGFVKKATLLNHGTKKVTVRCLDGIQNLMPYGIDQRFQLEYSTLADAYRKNELEAETGLGIYSMSSIPTDRAEPSEAMKATIAWSTGIETGNILITSGQLDAFRNGLPLQQEGDTRAAVGAYFIELQGTPDSGEKKSWYIVADIEKDLADVIALQELISREQNPAADIEQDVNRGTGNLEGLVARADGLQKSEDRLTASRHFSNVLFNIMRGGVFPDGYHIDAEDVRAFIKRSNISVYNKHSTFLEKLPDQSIYPDLLESAASVNDPHLERLIHEYLPLTFSRRHGDPSRPWNRFSIDIKDESGRKRLNYQGNWRDIFQNWEALALSFPAYIESMISKFVNASTIDGYNPYRVTREGVDWEILDPDDAWSYIGYWGDHQIIYLLKLLELSRKYHPGKLQSMLQAEIFVYADVPYRLRSYTDMLADPHNTVDFIHKQDQMIGQRVEKEGTDGKLLHRAEGDILTVNLTEKLLVPLLGKLSSFIPEAGIWLNTQRPEWNDANNALVGYGVSMVTLYYLRRHLKFLSDLFTTAGESSFSLSGEVSEWLISVQKVLQTHEGKLAGTLSDRERKVILDNLGEAGNRYRERVYESGFTLPEKELSAADLVQFCDQACVWIDHSIRANRRDDGLYHSYNLMKIVDGKEVRIRRLYEMLEGQVAVLSSGFLTTAETLEVLDALRESRLYRHDQNSYILYPDRSLPRFTEKNTIPPEDVRRSELLKKLISAGDNRVVREDIKGGVHFNGRFRNAADLRQALQNISEVHLTPLVEKEQSLLLEIYEKMFDHQSFTGRSGTFYKYEGLGSIYWHMVSKLLLAVQENYYRGLDEQADEKHLSDLMAHYYDVRKGIGVTKKPDVYGAFPTDPYSHTPAHAGAQQPGMTGQVKEDILSRFGELGVRVKEGKIIFSPVLLRQDAFSVEAGRFTYYNVSGQRTSIDIEKDSLAFTLAQVPVVYHLSSADHVIITFSADRQSLQEKLILDDKTSAALFNRTGEIRKIDVYFRPDF